MYRKPNGRLGVSFWTFANNFVPSMMVDSSADPGHVSLSQKDMFFSHHISAANPYALCPTSLWASGIIDHQKVSANALKKLQKCGVVSKDGIVDTTKIDGKFTHHMAIIPAKQQKQIIDLLFWWEEECNRLRKLDEEERELTSLVVDSTLSPGQREMYGRLLLRVQNKRRAKPSERKEDLERNEDELMLRFRAGAMNASAVTEDRGEPPAYSRY